MDMEVNKMFNIDECLEMSHLCDATYDIDQSIDEVLINETKFQEPHLSYEHWHALPEDAKKI